MILIAAGSSLPFCSIDSQQIVLHAFSALSRIALVKTQSGLYLSPAWPHPDDPPFINAVAQIETTIDPEALLAGLHAIEAGFGRRRCVRNAPRTLDLDLLAYHKQRRADGLILPHPRLRERDFVLAPLCEIAARWRHPVTGEAAQAMLDKLPARQARRIS